MSGMLGRVAVQCRFPSCGRTGVFLHRRTRNASGSSLSGSIGRIDRKSAIIFATGAGILGITSYAVSKFIEESNATCTIVMPRLLLSIYAVDVEFQENQL